MNKIVLFILIIIIVLYIIQKNNQIQNFINYVNPNKICIILTTVTKPVIGYGNEQERIDMYNQVINNYLQNTNIDIYVVNSSGYNFPNFQNNPRVFIYSFVQENKNILRFASYYEANSILKIYDHFNLQKYSYIIKITGRYFVSNIEDIINSIPEDTDLIFQYTHSKLLIKINQNSEIFGCKSIYLKEIMNKIIKNSNYISFERTLILLSFKYKYYQIMKGNLVTCINKGGENKKLCYL